MAENSDTRSTMSDKALINCNKAWAAQHQKNVDMEEYFPLESYQVLCQFYGELLRNNVHSHLCHTKRQWPFWGRGGTGESLQLRLYGGV